MIDPVAAAGGAAGAQRADGVPAPLAGRAFGDLLAEKLVGPADVRFSGHALQRIESRGIGVDESALVRLRDGLARLAAKGARESLVVIDRTAFVVSVPSRTVITAVDSEHMRDQVFTNIDSAVIA